MGRNTRIARLAFGALAALQLSLPASASLADAWQHGEDARARAHVESHATDACARIHPADCALCSYLTASVAVGRAAAVPISHTVAAPPPSAVGLDADRTTVRLPRSRAPPSLS